MDPDFIVVNQIMQVNDLTKRYNFALIATNYYLKKKTKPF